MLEDILIPIFICVVLPVAIIWIVMYTRQQEVKRKTEVMLFLHTWRQYILVPVAIMAVAFGLVLSKKPVES